MLVAFVLGLATRRTRGAAFVIVTFAMLELLGLVADNWTSLTGGSNGLVMPLPTWDVEYQNWPFYYALLGLLLLSIGMSAWIKRSKLGPRPDGHPRRRGQGGGHRRDDAAVQEHRLHGERGPGRRRGRRVRLLRQLPRHQRDVRHRARHPSGTGGPARRARHRVGPGSRRLPAAAADRADELLARRAGRRRDPPDPLRRPASRDHAPASPRAAPGARACRAQAPRRARAEPHRRAPRSSGGPREPARPPTRGGRHGAAAAARARSVEAVRRRDRARGRHLQRAGGFDHCADRPERLGKDDGLQPHRRHLHARRRVASSSAGSRSPTGAAPAARSRASAGPTSSRGCSTASRCSRTSPP